MSLDSLALRPLREKDAKVFFALVDANRVHLREFLPWIDEHLSLGHSQSFLAAAELQSDMQNGGLWGIFKEKQLLGTVTLHWIQWEHQCASMGYWVAKSSEGQGVAFWACAQLLEHCFGKLKLHRVELSAATSNQRSLNLALRLGFMDEGCRREAEQIRGAFLDQRFFGLLSQDYQRLGYRSNQK